MRWVLRLVETGGEGGGGVLADQVFGGEFVAGAQGGAAEIAQFLALLLLEAVKLLAEAHGGPLPSGAGASAGPGGGGATGSLGGRSSWRWRM